MADVAYAASSRLLLVGEGNFSFASALHKRFGDCSGITATSFEPREELVARWGSGLDGRLRSLEASLCGIHHSVSADDLPRRFRAGSFDSVAFNFPLCADSPGEAAGDAASHGARARRRYAQLADLLSAFFRGAAHVLRLRGKEKISGEVTRALGALKVLPAF